MISVADLPALNAALNLTSTVLLLAGYAFIRRKRVFQHKVCMLAATLTSALFLTSYLIYHYQAGSRLFTGSGSIRLLYFSVLISHVILAALIPPLAGVTLYRALKGRFDRHRRIARLTLPLWLYVSFTGIVVYWMLYQLNGR